MEFTNILTTLMLLSIIFLVGNSRWNSPHITIVNRWLRWVTFSLITGHFIQILELSEKPLPLLVITCFLSWFLIETLYTWFGIRTLNYSTASLFPRFKVNQDGAEWPNDKLMIKLRDYLRKQKFVEDISVNSFIFDSLYIPSTLFLNGTKTIRLQVLFFPTRSGKASPHFILTSESKEGSRYITDNIPMPYGGYYPDEWYPYRKPLTKSLPKLLDLHKKRLDESNETFVAWEGNLCDDLNREQHTLEQLNTQEGFLMPAHMQNAYGQLSLEGRYRIWKEVWLLKYLGHCPN